GSSQSRRQQSGSGRRKRHSGAHVPGLAPHQLLEQLLSQRKASAENGRGLFRSRHCVEVLNKLQVEGKVPSSAEEGWMRDYKNAAKQPKFAQTGGVDQVQFNSLDQHHP